MPSSRQAGPSNGQRARQTSIEFVKSDRREDRMGLPQADPAGESQAWAGLMNGDLSDDDSDSDQSEAEVVRSHRGISPSSSSSQPSGPSGSNARASWSTRAAAVGSRPPDNASQNPPTLKLLGLKSLKEGGVPLGSSGSSSPMSEVSPASSARQLVEKRQMEEQMRRNQEAQRSQRNGNGLRVESGFDQDEQAGRHGSMIDFGGGLHDAGARTIHDSPERIPAHTMPSRQERGAQPLPNLSIPRGPVEDGLRTPRTELTHQLGLDGRVPTPVEGGIGGDPYGQSRNLIPAHGVPSPPHAPVRMGGMGGSNPSSTAAGGERVPLQRGNFPPPLALMPGGGQAQARGPPTPQPIPLPSPVHMPPQQANRHLPPQPSRGEGMDMRGGPSNMIPAARAAPGPGFSDSQAPPPAQHARRPSLFRRSKAFLTGYGGNAMPPSAPSAQQAGAMAQPQQRRRSLFRRSLAMLTGRGNEGPPGMQGHAMQQLSDHSHDSHDSNAPAPRVQGFIDEKPKDRRSLYIGGGGMGDEWDVNGNGARFWRRFSLAQHKLQAGEFRDLEQKRVKVEKRRKFTKYASLIGGMMIIFAVVGIVIWRENIKSSDVPGALDRASTGSTNSSQSLSSVMAKETQSAQAGSATTSANSAAGTTAVTASTNNALQNDGSTDSTDSTDSTGSTDDTTTTHRRKKHHNDNGNRRRDMVQLNDSVRVVRLVIEQVEQTLPLVQRTEPLALHSHMRLLRKRRV